MGKNTGNRKKSSGPEPPPLASFFSPSGPRSDKAAADGALSKMAGAKDVAGEDSFGAIGKEEWRSELAGGFQRMEASLLEKLTCLIAPITAQVQDLKQGLEQVTQTAESAMELALTNQETSKQHQSQHEWAAEKIMLIENQLKIFNLKLRGLPEGCEENQELRIFVSNWLATQMELEKGVAPLLDAAYRLGPPRRASNALPRDILIRCSDMRTKTKILSLTRSKGQLQFLHYKIQVLQDLSSETLEARRRLRPLTSLLAKEKIRYRWQAFVKVQVIHKGTALTAHDLNSAIPLLETLGLEVPDDFRHPNPPADRDDWKPA